MLKSCFF